MDQGGKRENQKVPPTSRKKLPRAGNLTCASLRDVVTCPTGIFVDNYPMSTHEMLLAEIKNQPEPVLREVWHYLRFLTRQREEEAWADVLPSREVEQEVLNILDGNESASR